MKPWLLMNEDERKARQEQWEQYQSQSILTGYYDEGLAIMLRPPPTELQANLELYFWQLRHKNG